MSKVILGAVVALILGAGIYFHMILGLFITLVFIAYIGYVAMTSETVKSFVKRGGKE